MLVTVILYGLLLAGSFFGAAVLNRRFEEILPISIMSMAVILFLFGVFKMLEIGVVSVVAIIILLYVISAIKLFKNKNSAFVANFFTPAFFIFTALYLVLNYAQLGLVARIWDEFSHWMDCVKAMTYLNDFVANSESHSLLEPIRQSCRSSSILCRKYICLFTLIDRLMNGGCIWHIKCLPYQYFFRFFPNYHLRTL